MSRLARLRSTPVQTQRTGCPALRFEVRSSVMQKRRNPVSPGSSRLQFPPRQTLLTSLRHQKVGIPFACIAVPQDLQTH